MSLRATHKIALGFALLVIAILIVGGGGLWSNANINQRLHQIADRALPVSTASAQQLVALQKANIALLQALANLDQDPGQRQQHAERFNLQVDEFGRQQQILTPLLSDSPELSQLLQTTATAKSQFAEAALIAMQQHDQRVQLQLQTRTKQSQFQRQVDTLITWGQRYLAKLQLADAQPLARSLLQIITAHKNQLLSYNQNHDIEALNRALANYQGKLLNTLNQLIELDNKAAPIKGMVEGLNKELYSPQGLVDFHRQLDQIEAELQQTLTTSEQMLDQTQQAAQEFSSQSAARSAQLSQQADRTSRLSNTLISILLVAATALAVIISTLTVRAISKPLKQILEQLALAADGDMRVEFDQRRQDEFGQLGLALNELFSKMSHALEQISSSSEQLNSVAEKNAVISDQTTQAMEDQSQQLELTSSAASEMESTVAEVSNHASHTLEAVQQCEQLSIDADRSVQRTLTSIQSQSADINEAMGLSEQLSEYGQQIGTILDTIGNIAEQTNLLALNAAIEAARAGEHGRGFAVVADEVRALASRTQNSTHEIQEMVENMQSSITQVGNVMQHSVEQSQLCVDNASDSQTALTQMNQAIANIRTMSTQITEAANQQNLAVEEVSRTLVRINQAAAETSEGAQQVNTTSNDLVTVAHQQQALIRHFKV